MSYKDNNSGGIPEMQVTSEASAPLLSGSEIHHSPPRVKKPVREPTKSNIEKYRVN